METQEKMLTEMKAHLHSIYVLASLMEGLTSDRPLSAGLFNGCGRVLLRDCVAALELADSLEP